MAFGQRLLPPLQGGVEDLLIPLYQGIIILILRVAAERTLLPRLRAALKARGAPEPAPRAAAASAGGAGDASEKRIKDAHRIAHEVIDNAFLVAFIAPLSVWGWYVLMYHNGPCTPLAPAGCLVGWPNHPVDPAWRLWWLSVGGLYIAEMLGTALGGLGFKLSGEMITHHAVTMVLMLYGYFGGLHRYGGMATTVLDTSNTFLHLAKAAHAPGLPSLARASDMLFKAFALVFFIGTMLYPGFKYGCVLPTHNYIITNGLMVIVYALQLMWFYKIVRIATGGDAAAGKPKKAAAAAAAPAGATGAVPPPQAAVTN